jgi:UDP-glucuronate decarboxylase
MDFTARGGAAAGGLRDASFDLLAAGNDVLCVDNYFTGSKQNVKGCLTNPRFELIRHDVTFPLYVEVDEIYNLACPASPIHY